VKDSHFFFFLFFLGKNLVQDHLLVDLVGICGAGGRVENFAQDRMEGELALECVFFTLFLLPHIFKKRNKKAKEEMQIADDHEHEHEHERDDVICETFRGLKDLFIHDFFFFFRPF